MNNSRKKSKLATAILVVISCILLVMPALAGQGNGTGGGQGNGTGGGQDQPLSLVSSIPADGAKDFPVNGEIILNFNKNVVNMTVVDNNKACFGLYTSDGTQVAAEVIMADDQIDPDQRETVKIKPSQELGNGTAYIVKISPQLQSKSGDTLGQETIIKFATAAAGAGASTTPANSGQEVEPAPTATDKTSDTGTQNSNLIYILIAGVILIAGAGYWYARKARQK